MIDLKKQRVILILDEYKDYYIKDKIIIFNKYRIVLTDLLNKICNKKEDINSRFAIENVNHIIDIIIRKNIDVNLLYFLTKNTSSSIYTHKLLEQIVEYGIKEYKQEIMLNNISKDFV